MFHCISAVNYLLKIKERSRQTVVNTYLFGDLGETKSKSNDSGIDEIDPFNISPHRPRTDSQASSGSLSQTDLNGGVKIAIERTFSAASDTDQSDSSQSQLFVTSDTDSDLGSEGYQVSHLKTGSF